MEAVQEILASSFRRLLSFEVKSSDIHVESLKIIMDGAIDRFLRQMTSYGKKLLSGVPWVGTMA